MVGQPPVLSPQARREILAEWEGEIWQRPPAFSALKIAGKRAYALARQGKEVSLPPRKVVIYQIEEVFYHPQRWLLRVVTGKGVYIRSLAQDIGDRVGCGAYLGSLRRTRIGQFSVYGAHQPDAVAGR